MPPITRSIQKRALLIQNFLKDSMMSSEHYDSTQIPFFSKDSESKDYEMDYQSIVDIPTSLNQSIQMMYRIIGNPSVEIYKGDWTIMSLDKAMRIYKEYKENGQERIFDIAYIYAGMGHIIILSCDLKTHNLFYHSGGGSSGWDRELNFKRTITMDPETTQQYYFLQWIQSINANS